MKTIQSILVLSGFLLLNSCSTTTKFPLSTVTPAAEISAKKRIDKQNNFTLEITASNLASAERNSPPGNNYSVWIVSKNNGTKNVGQLNVKNGKKTTFKTVTPFDFEEIFITIEDKGDMSYPTGVEISRAKF